MSVDIRDRTLEFQQTVDQFRARQSQHNASNGITSSSQHNGVHHNNNNNSSSSAVTANGSNITSLLQPQQHTNVYTKTSQFTSAAQNISAQIAAITQSLEQLALLAKQRSLFNDNTDEINSLIHNIKNDISYTQNDLSLLQDFVNAQSGLGGRAAGQHSTAVVNELRTKLAGTTKSFTMVLKQRTDNLKAQQTRRQQFDSTSSQTNGAAMRRRTGNAFDSLMTEDSQPLLNGQQQQSQEQQAVILQQQDQSNDYLTQRAEAVESIESTITQLGQMYQQLVELVGQQEEVVLRIDTNIDDTLVNVEAGHTELLKYFDSISGSRWLILKVFTVLILFVIFFMLFVA